MKNERKISENVFEVGCRDPTRKMFDELIPLPNGTSYNSYLIKGSEKTALIDTVDPRATMQFMENIAFEKIDYIISNHAEQDHSGSIPEVLKWHPNAKIVTNHKCKEMLISHLNLKEENFKIIADGEELSLGNKTLKFYLTPWVHWPETMCTYLVEDKILFTCDFFGSHYATNELFSSSKNLDKTIIESSIKRYYAEIMMPFRIMIQKNIEKIETLIGINNIKIIATSHGPIYNNPEYPINLYKKWVSNETEKQVAILYVSMHGSTKTMADYIEQKLNHNKIKNIKVDLSGADLGTLAIESVETSTIILGFPTTIGTIHPLAHNIINVLSLIKPKTKYLGFFGSHGWANMKHPHPEELCKKLNAENLGFYNLKGLPTGEELKQLDKLIEDITIRNKQ